MWTSSIHSTTSHSTTKLCCGIYPLIYDEDPQFSQVIRTVYACLIPLVRATRPSHHILRDMDIMAIDDNNWLSVEVTWSSSTSNFSILLLIPLS